MLDCPYAITGRRELLQHVLFQYHPQKQRLDKPVITHCIAVPSTEPSPTSIGPNKLNGTSYGSYSCVMSSPRSGTPENASFVVNSLYVSRCLARQLNAYSCVLARCHSASLASSAKQSFRNVTSMILLNAPTSSNRNFGRSQMLCS